MLHHGHMERCSGLSGQRQLFCACVQSVDDGVANITEALERNGLFDKSVIIFLSDNGAFPQNGGLNYGSRFGHFRGGSESDCCSSWIGPRLGPEQEIELRDSHATRQRA